MANPRRRHSKARSRSRRANYYSRLDAPATMACPNCGEAKLMHRACPSCGHYRGRKVVDRKDAA